MSGTVSCIMFSAGSYVDIRNATCSVMYTSGLKPVKKKPDPRISGQVPKRSKGHVLGV